jgi:2'-5' RNA ligase
MPAAATCRLFLALWPGAATRRALLAERDRCAWPAHARPTAAGDLHLTLHFIGPVPVDQVPTLVRTLAVAAPRFTLHPGDHAQWGEHVAVLEPAPPPAGIMVLHERLAQALRAQGLPLETRAFRPHVTLARTHGPIEPPPGGAAPWRWPVASYVLAQSVPGRPYRVLARFRLGAAARKHATAAAR